MNESSIPNPSVSFPILTTFLRNIPLIGITLLLAACGGGDSKVLNNGSNVAKSTSKSSSSVASSSSSMGWVAGVYESSAEFKDLCEVPRTGISKYTNERFPDKKGSRLDEKNFLRSWSHETYLWFDELPDLNPATSGTPQQYFDLLKTHGKTVAGVLKDNFHFYEPTEQAEAMDIGVTYGYGIELSVESVLPPRKYYVAYVEPGSPAANAGVTRGSQILEIDSYDLVEENSEAGLSVLNEGLFPSKLNVAHEFKFLEAGASEPRIVTLQSAEVATSPVLLSNVLETGGEKVGYIVFNSHVEKAQDQWVAAIDQLKQAAISDVILDLRYNGGGLISIASQVGYMLAGTNVEGKVFFKQIQNNKQKKINPLPFLNVGLYGAHQNTTLPTLDLKRVYILSSSGTCSASEAIINGLRGADIEVYLFGDTTCGKPYGFYPQPNCGTTYYTIQLKGANAKDFGEYNSGFSPVANPENETQIQGCAAADDLRYPLGDTRENLLATALHFRATGSCLANNSRLQKTSVPAISGEFIAPEVRKLLLLK